MWPKVVELAGGRDLKVAQNCKRQPSASAQQRGQNCARATSRLGQSHESRLAPFGDLFLYKAHCMQQKSGLII